MSKLAFLLDSLRSEILSPRERLVFVQLVIGYLDQRRAKSFPEQKM